MGFLYFLPGRSAAGAADLEQAGISDRFPRRPGAAQRPLTVGPDGGPGVLLAATPAECLYEPTSQTWMEMPGGNEGPGTGDRGPDGNPKSGPWGRPQADEIRPGGPAARNPKSAAAWLGLPAERPHPASLARPEIVDGYPLELGDGQEWIIPTARVFPQGTRLPEALAIGPEGKLVKKALPAFAAACRDAERIWEAMMHDHGRRDGPAPEPIQDQEAWDMACRILAINYRVGPAEVAALGLLTTANLKLVLGWFVDLPGCLRVLDAKKNDTPPDGGPSASGPPD